MKRPIAVAFSSVLLFAPCTPCMAQDPPGPAPGTQESSTELQGTERVVEVDSPTADEAIEERLARILSTASLIEELVVRVDDGVVFLGGWVDHEDDSAWASAVALRTEGVVAVRNDLEVVAGVAWDLAPARAELEELWKSAIRSLPLFLLGLAVLVVTALFSKAITRLVSGILTRRTSNRILRAAIEKAVMGAVVLGGVYLFLRLSGLTRVAATLLGGTGLLGLILGLAFRDLAENFLSSLLISLQRPFRLGDTVEIEGFEGVVERVTMRGTVLMDFMGNTVQIPNALVYKGTIRNMTVNPKRRIEFSLGIGFDASIVNAQRVAMQVLSAHSAVLNDPEPMVLVERLGSATIDLRVYFWIDGHQHSWLKVRSAVMRLVLRAMEEEGITMPDEAREVVFPQGVPVQMQREGSAAAAASAAPSAAQAAPPDAARTEDSELEVTEAEGDLRSDVHELRQQADASRRPEDGPDLLE